MEIRISQTPNPNARKFVLSERRFPTPLSFPNATAAAADELAAQLFAVGGIYNVFMVQDFITINKYPDTPWESLTGQLERIIVAYFGNQP